MVKPNHAALKVELKRRLGQETYGRKKIDNIGVVSGLVAISTGSV